jgi:hypothetical protein
MAVRIGGAGKDLATVTNAVVQSVRRCSFLVNPSKKASQRRDRPMVSYLSGRQRSRRASAGASFSDSVRPTLEAEDGRLSMTVDVSTSVIIGCQLGPHPGNPVFALPKHSR